MIFKIRHSKGFYFDGHEREDGLQHRKEHRNTLASLEHSPQLVNFVMVPPPPIIRVFHDESTFHADISLATRL